MWFEQGLGDQIMFARWVPELVRRGVAVTLVCSPPLARLFGGLGVTVIPAAGEIAVPQHDAWCLMGSLPHLVGGLPTAPYLPSGPGGGGIGVAPTGNPEFIGDARRSLPEPFASELLAMGCDLRPAATGAADMEDTRRIVAGLDLVLSVDTSVAHLAGAMGKPVKLLAPHVAEWRWGLGDRSALYPTIEVLRQSAPGDWRSVLDRLGRGSGSA